MATVLTALVTVANAATLIALVHALLKLEAGSDAAHVGLHSSELGNLTGTDTYPGLCLEAAS